MAISAAAPAHNFSAVGTTKGLEARIVPSLLVDRDGFLWVGSQEGLFRFDGYEALAFRPDPSKPGSISDDDIRVVYEDTGGALWVGTYSAGLNRYDSDTGDFEVYRHDSGDPASIVDDSILAIADGPQGGLWTATRKGLSRLDKASGQFENFLHDPDDPASLPVDWVDSLHWGASGRLWIGTIGGGVQQWHPQSRSFVQFDLPAMSGGRDELNDVFAMYEATDGRLWVGTRTGLVVLDSANSTAVEIPLAEGNEYLPAITSMAADRSGRLWLGTLVHGVLIIDMESAEWEHRGAVGPGPDHLQDQPQMSLAMTQDALFVGTWGSGVYRTISHSSAFELLRKSSNPGLVDENITAVIATDEAGRPWLGTQGAGLQRADIATQSVEATSASPDDLREARVLDLARLNEDRLIAGTSRGVFTFTQSGQQVDRLSYDPAYHGGLVEEPVRTLLPTGESVLWMGTETRGLYYHDSMNSKLWSHRHRADAPDSLSGDSVTALLTGADGYLWVGTRSNGLNYCRIQPWSCQRFSPEDGSSSALSHHSVTTLLRGLNGEVWVGTGGGLNRVLQDSRGRVTAFQRWTREQGLLDDGIMSIEQDVDGSLWLSTRQGLTRLDPETNRILNYVEESGLPASRFNPASSAADSRHIYFGSVHGLLSFPKGSLWSERKPSAVRIASIERAAPGEKQRPTRWPNGRLSVPYKEFLSIKLATLDLSESPHEYAYRLNIDEPWIAMGSQRQLMLHGLVPGEYVFQARGRDVFGYWSESEPLRLEIVPPFWMTNWFRGLVALFLLMAAVLILIAREAALRRRSHEIRRLAEKREQALEQQLGSAAELSVLTPRQKEVLQLLAEGKSMKAIADILNISIKTVEAHRANLMDRLEIRDIPGLVKLAIRSRLVSPYE
ncbi:MAG: two-component regulator propeller domain-containing protein [Xanthomonadales bacterium]|nr:two-component regulator propeller domain-containing protein [Xanthomonadales bacterium]